MELNCHDLNDYIRRVRRRSSVNQCKYNVAAICFDSRGSFLGIAYNSPRLPKEGGGLHAEISALRKFGPNIKSIILIRTTTNGKLRPIHPCEACSKVLAKNKITIVSIFEQF